MAIVDYLDHVHPARPLLPTEAQARARVIQICEIINSGIQPLQNLKVTQLLERDHGWSKAESDAWVRIWIERGLASLERVLTDCAGTYAFGGEVTAADCFIVPQCFSSRRFGVTVEKYPTLARVEAACLGLPEFQRAHPDKQPDYAP
jgi:maleylacetoacetate isomerase